MSGLRTCFTIRRHPMLRQAGAAKAGDHQAEHFLKARLRRHDAVGKSLLFTDDGQRREYSANLVAGETDEDLPLRLPCVIAQERGTWRAWRRMDGADWR